MPTAKEPSMIEEIISYRSKKQLYFNLCETYNINDKYLFKKDSILTKYKDVLLSQCIQIDLGERFETRYKYRPKNVSYDIYGTVDLWYLLLWLNNMSCYNEFTKSTINIYNPEGMSLLNKIINIEQETITKYNKTPHKITKAE